MHVKFLTFCFFLQTIRMTTRKRIRKASDKTAIMIINIIFVGGVTSPPVLSYSSARDTVFAIMTSDGVEFVIEMLKLSWLDNAGTP